MPETKKIRIKVKATAQEILSQLAISSASKKAGAKALRNAAKATPAKKGRTKRTVAKVAATKKASIKRAEPKGIAK